MDAALWHRAPGVTGERGVASAGKEDPGKLDACRALVRDGAYSAVYRVLGTVVIIAPLGLCLMSGLPRYLTWAPRTFVTLPTAVNA